MRAIVAWGLMWGQCLMAACGKSDEEKAADRLEQACRDFCDAAFGNGCDLPGLDAEQCDSSCGFLDQQLQGRCVGEYTAVFECTAEGGFSCMEGVAIPNNPCVSENEAFVACSQALNCQSFCDQAAAQGCPPGGSAGACASACDATRAELGNCSGTYDFYLQCATAFDDLVCLDGRPSSPDCDEDLVDVGSCLVQLSGEPCKGLCFVHEALGCGTSEDCEAACDAERAASPACIDEHDDWVDCVVDVFSTPTCDGSSIQASGCDRTAFETCAAM